MTAKTITGTMKGNVEAIDKTPCGIKFLFGQKIPEGAEELLNSKIKSGEISSWGYFYG